MNQDSATLTGGKPPAVGPHEHTASTGTAQSTPGSIATNPPIPPVEAGEAERLASLRQSLLAHAEPLVAISTAHLRPETRRRLTDEALSVLAYGNEYGGFLYVTPDANEEQPSEGGSLQPRGRYCTPESYIRRIRRLMDGAASELPRGGWRPRLRVAPDHPVVAEMQWLSMETTTEAWFGDQRVVADIPPEQFAAYFGLIDRYVDELPAWCWVQVYGLTAS